MFVDIGEAASRWMTLKVEQNFPSDEHVAILLLEIYYDRTCAPDNQDVTETKDEVHYDLGGVKEGVASAKSNLYNFPCICGATGTCKCHLENAGLRTEKIPSSGTDVITHLKKEDRIIGIQLHSSILEQGSKPLANEEHPKGNGQMQAAVYPTEFNNHVVGTNDKSASTQKNTSPHNFIFIKILPDANISKEENQKPNPGFKLMCRFCQKGFNSKTTMNTHQIKFHSDQRQSACKICKRNFANDQSLRFHIKKGHTACEVCLESFPNVDDLESHRVKNRHKYLQRSQDNSPTRQKINKDMQTIWKQSITKLQYQCTHCKSYFISKETRQEHQRQAHPELRRFKCSICNGRYATNGSLRHHMNRTHKACHVCYTRFNDNNELERHKTETGHKNDVQSCTDTPDEAKASTSQPQQIDPEIMPNEENLPLTADLGHFSLSVHEVSRILNTANYNTGMRNETNCIDTAIKDNDSSNFSLKQEYDNAHHPEFMSGTFTIKCSLCDETFPSQANLKCHLSAVHYSCAVCKTTFKDNTDFRIHRAETGHMSGIVIIFSEEEVKKPKSKTELKFKCRWCRKAFNSISVRIKHQKRFHSQSRQPPLIIYRDKNKIKPESYLCTACKMSFPTRKLRYTHVIQDHPELRVHRCHLCTESFIIKGYLINHLNEVHHACENCKTSYVTAKDLVRHQKETCLGDSANTSQVKCRSRKCRNFFRNLHERQEHIDAEHPELMTRIKCDFCDDTFSYRTNLRNHIDVEHQGLTTNERDLKTAASTLECSLCNEGFSSQTSLTNHLSAIHYFCAVCKVTFNDMIGLQKHKAETGHIPGCNLCKVCAQSFPTTKELKKHRREAGHGEVCPTCGCMIYSCLSSHIKSHNIEYKCHLCATVCKEKQQLKRHIEIIHKRKQQPFECRGCGHPVATANLRQVESSFHCIQCGLDLHIAGNAMKSKEEIKDHVCFECGRGYSFRSTLNYHIRAAHSGQEKKFKCNLCDFKAWQKSKLIRHIKGFHEKSNRTIPCPHCPKMVGSPPQLRRHLLCHSGIKPFKCSEPECNASYKDRTNLKIHMKNIHNQ